MQRTPTAPQFNAANFCARCPLCLRKDTVASGDDVLSATCSCSFTACKQCWEVYLASATAGVEKILCPRCREPFPTTVVAEAVNDLAALSDRPGSDPNKHSIFDDSCVLALRSVPMYLCDKARVRSPLFLGQYGEISDVEVIPDCGFIAVRYCSSADAALALKATNNQTVLALDGDAQSGTRTLDSHLIPSWLCESVLLDKPCEKQDCLCLHEPPAPGTKVVATERRHLSVMGLPAVADDRPALREKWLNAKPFTPSFGGGGPQVQEAPKEEWFQTYLGIFPKDLLPIIDAVSIRGTHPNYVDMNLPCDIGEATPGPHHLDARREGHGKPFQLHMLAPVTPGEEEKEREKIEVIKK